MQGAHSHLPCLQKGRALHRIQGLHQEERDTNIEVETVDKVTEEPVRSNQMDQAKEETAKVQLVITDRGKMAPAKNV